MGPCGGAAVSWVIRRKSDGAAICEIFSPRLATAVNAAKYEAIPFLDYIGEVNRKAKELQS